MKVVSIGGGPAGLYTGILLKLADPRHEVVVYERNRADDTFGFGVVFSDSTLGKLASADPETQRRISAEFAHWDDIHVHFGGQVLVSKGHGFAGLSRKTLLRILYQRAQELGVQIRSETEVTDALAFDADLVLGADGVNSGVRAQLAEHFQPQLDWRPNRFVWLGTTFPFEAFTFYFERNTHGLFRVHAYRYEEGASTFIVECTDATWRAAGLDRATEDETVAYCEELFSKQLAGHRLLKNRSLWRAFPTISNARWSYKNVVLLGDAVHTAHFSIGSGTKLAMEDSIALVDALKRHAMVSEALAAYEAERRPEVEAIQRAAQVSLEWFENTERYESLEPQQFAFSLLTRSLRVTHENLALRDPKFIADTDAWFGQKVHQKGDLPARPAQTPPMFQPYRLRELVLENRVVVSPMCMYSAEDGKVDDWHLVHLGSRAIGGAGLVIAEMTDVSADGRITPGCAGLYREDHVPAWRRVTSFVHQHSQAKIGAQLAHAGRKGATKKLWEGPDQPLESGAWPLIAASAIPYLRHSQVPKAMDRDDMDRVTADFVRATEFALASDFDLIELHAAHGYLLATFLSPLTNLRTDEYGGSLENRLRYPLEVFSAVRAAWPQQRPMSVRISAHDWIDGGVTDSEAVLIAQAFHRAGADIIDVSSGQTAPGAKPRYGRLYQTPFSERIRLEGGVPTMTVGAITSYADVNSILAAGRADLCVLARAHLYDPYWTHHAAHEQNYPLPWPPQYLPMQRYSFRFK